MQHVCYVVHIDWRACRTYENQTVMTLYCPTMLCDTWLLSSTCSTIYACNGITPSWSVPVIVAGNVIRYIDIKSTVNLFFDRFCFVCLHSVVRPQVNSDSTHSNWPDRYTCQSTESIESSVDCVVIRQFQSSNEQRSQGATYYQSTNSVLYLWSKITATLVRPLKCNRFAFPLSRVTSPLSVHNVTLKCI